MAIEAFLGTRPQRIFIGIIVLQALVVLAMVGIVFGKVEAQVNTSRPGYRTIPCYLALFGLAELFEVLISLDALKLRNTIQLIGIILFHCAMIIFSGLQISQTHKALVTQPGSSCEGQGYANCDGPESLFSHVLSFLVVVPAALGVALIGLVWTTRELFAEFGWAIFHAIGADPRLKSMYQYYQVMVCLLKFDFFFFSGVTMQLLILVLTNDRTEFVLTITAIPIVLFLLILCGVALQREIKWLMGASLLLMAAAESYFVYKLIRIYQPESETGNQYSTTRGSLTIFIVVAALLLLLTFAVGIRCFADFNQGLQQSKMTDPEKARKQKTGTPGQITPGMGERNSSYMGGPLQPRISIE